MSVGTNGRVVEACPECDGSTVYEREYCDGGRRARAEERFRCHDCGATFAAPVRRPSRRAAETIRVETGGHNRMAGDYPDDWDDRRRRVYVRAEWSCEGCGATDVRFHAHHKTPIGEGGTHDLDNLEALCSECHASEHDAGVCFICKQIAWGASHTDVYDDSGAVHVGDLCKRCWNAILTERHELQTKYSEKNPPVCTLCREDLEVTSYSKYGISRLSGHPPTGCSMCKTCRSAIVHDHPLLADRVSEWRGRIATRWNDS